MTIRHRDACTTTSTPSVSGASPLPAPSETEALQGRAAPAAYTTVPHGQRRCEDCTFYHPERKKVCSAFGDCQNKDGDCSLYI